MIVPAFTLDWFNDDGGDVRSFAGKNLADLRLGPVLLLHDLGGAARLGERIIEARGKHARPGELGKIIGLARLGVRQAQRIARAPVKRALEVEDVRAPFAPSHGAALANPPVPGRSSRLPYPRLSCREPKR